MKKFLIGFIFVVFIGTLFFNPIQVLASDEERVMAIGLVYTHSFLYTGAEELFTDILTPNLSLYSEFTNENQKGIAGLSFEVHILEDNLLVRGSMAWGNTTKFRVLRPDMRYSIRGGIVSLECQKGFSWNRSNAFITGIGGGFNIFTIGLDEEHNGEYGGEVKAIPFFSISQRFMLMRNFWLEIGYQRNLLSPKFEFTVDADPWDDTSSGPTKKVSGLGIESEHYLIRLSYRF